MRLVLSLYRSTVGKKIAMAASGIVLVGYVVGHMAGNLKAFFGAEKIDGYGEFLREFGHEALGHGGFLWIVRGILIVALVVHVTAAVQLTRTSLLARPEGYKKHMPLDASNPASRTMRWGGVFLLVFVVYHLLHFTVGSLHPDFVPGGVYHNLRVAFQSGLTVAVYLAAMTALGFHLYHGIWSTFQTLGINHPRYNRYRRPLAVGLALVTALGFSLVPIAFITGILS